MRVVRTQGIKTAANRASKKAKAPLSVKGLQEAIQEMTKETLEEEVTPTQLVLGDHADMFESPESSNVKKAAYSVLSKMLVIWFKSGMYRYDGVPLKVWLKFKDASSKGAFVGSDIVGPDRLNPIYKGVKVDG